MARYVLVHLRGFPYGHVGHGRYRHQLAQWILRIQDEYCVFNHVFQQRHRSLLLVLYLQQVRDIYHLKDLSLFMILCAVYSGYDTT